MGKILPMPVAKCRNPPPQTNLSPAPLGKRGVHELPTTPQASPCGPRLKLPSSLQPSQEPFCIKYK